MKLKSIFTKRFEFINNLEKNNGNNSWLNELISSIGRLLFGSSSYFFWDMSLKNKVKYISFILLGVIIGIGIIVATGYILIHFYFQNNY